MIELNCDLLLIQPLLDVKLQGVEVCDLLLIQPLLDVEK